MTAMPRFEDVGIRPLLERNAAEDPDGPFVGFEDGTTWTRREALDEVYRAANALRERGVRQRQVVAVLLGNGPDFLRCWWGLAALGATCAMFNPAYRGRVLDDLLELTDPVLVVAEQPPRTRRSIPVLDPAQLRLGPAGAPELERPPQLWDLHGILCTSGTTGRSKAVLQSHHHLHTTGAWATVDVGLGPADTLLVDLPLFHAGLNSFTVGCLATRSRLAIRSRPEVSRYWEVLRETGATIAVGLSATAALLQSRPVAPDERDHRLRYWIGVPLPDDPLSFAERFGITGGLLGAYGCSEIGVGVVARPGVAYPRGSCGIARDGFELRLVDEHDIDVPTGEVGELMLRTNLPWAISHGYLGDPAATVRAWRNGWFHTGDALSVDEDGHYYFRDRISDVIRRRGENISSFEIEREVAAHPEVREAACVAVPSPTGVEDEIKVFLVAEPALDLVALMEWLFERLPYFMIPRYVELGHELPRTPTGRVRKFELRAREAGPVVDGPVVDGPVVDGPVVDGSVVDGPVVDGPVWDREDHLTITRTGVIREPARSRAARPERTPR